MKGVTEASMRDGVDLLEEYGTMIREAPVEPPHSPRVTAIIEDIQHSIRELAYPYIDRSEATLEEVQEAMSHSGGPFPTELRGVMADTIYYDEVTSGTIASGAITASRIADSGLVYGESIMMEGIGLRSNLEVNNSGTLITRNSDGDEVIRIDSEGIHVNGRLIITADGGVRYA